MNHEETSDYILELEQRVRDLEAEVDYWQARCQRLEGKLEGIPA